MYNINFEYVFDVKTDDIINLLMTHLLVDNNLFSKSDIDILNEYIKMM